MKTELISANSATGCKQCRLHGFARKHKLLQHFREVHKEDIDYLLGLSAEKKAFLREPLIAEERFFYGGGWYSGRYLHAKLGRLLTDDGGWTEWSGVGRDEAVIFSCRPLSAVENQKELARSSGGDALRTMVMMDASSGTSPLVRLPSLPVPIPLFEDSRAAARFDLNCAFSPMWSVHQQAGTDGETENAYGVMERSIVGGFGLTTYVDERGVDALPARTLKSNAPYNASTLMSGVGKGQALNMPGVGLNTDMDSNMSADDLKTNLDFNMLTDDLSTDKAFDIPAVDLNTSMDFSSFFHEDPTQGVATTTFSGQALNRDEEH